MRKQRGLKRYYRNLTKQNDLDKATWLDFDSTKDWSFNRHLHFDRRGFGNTSFKRRKPHLDKLLRHFDLLIEKTKNLKTADFQLYMVLLDFSSDSDALFLHAPNVNNSQFPFEISELSSSTTLKSEALNKYINQLDGYEKLYGEAGEAFCLLYKKKVGIPFKV